MSLTEPKHVCILFRDVVSLAERNGARLGGKTEARARAKHCGPREHVTRVNRRQRGISSRMLVRS